VARIQRQWQWSSRGRKTIDSLAIAIEVSSPTARPFAEGRHDYDLVRHSARAVARLPELVRRRFASGPRIRPDNVASLYPVMRSQARCQFPIEG